MWCGSSTATHDGERVALVGLGGDRPPPPDPATSRVSPHLAGGRRSSPPISESSSSRSHSSVKLRGVAGGIDDPPVADDLLDHPRRTRRRRTPRTRRPASSSSARRSLRISASPPWSPIVPSHEPSVVTAMSSVSCSPSVVQLAADGDRRERLHVLLGRVEDGPRRLARRSPPPPSLQHVAAAALRAARRRMRTRRHRGRSHGSLPTLHVSPSGRQRRCSCLHRGTAPP